MKLLPIKKPGGGNMTGGSTPGEIWKMFMDKASKAIDAPNEDFLPNVAGRRPEPQGQRPRPAARASRRTRTASSA